MGWLDDLRKWLSEAETRPPGEASSPPPVFTVAPRSFGVVRDVAGVEWQTDKRTSGLVRYRACRARSRGPRSSTRVVSATINAR